MIYALAGNQNCGKTTLFNQLTGSNQHVGNFPGVTVDSKMGEIRGEKGNAVVDLPGIYSIRPYTNEEIVTRSLSYRRSRTELSISLMLPILNETCILPCSFWNCIFPWY